MNQKTVQYHTGSLDFQNVLRITKGNSTILVPEVIAGRYRIEDILSASTGFGLILIANDMNIFERKVLIKASNYKGTIKKGNLDNEKIINQRRKEIEYEFKILNIIRRINPPNVTVARDFVRGYCPTISPDETFLKDYAYTEPYIVLQYIPGITLEEFLEQKDIDRQSTDWQKKVLSLAKQILKTFRKMHRAGEKIEKIEKLIYQDLKPGNILVTGQSNFALIDFGGVATITKEKMIFNRGIGTYGYMPPEVADATLPFDERVDIYTIGIVMYEMLTGINPSVLADKDGIANLEYSELKCTEEIKKIVRKATKHNVKDRYMDTTSMIEDILLALKNLNSRKTICITKNNINKLENSNLLNKVDNNKKPCNGIDQSLFENLFDDLNSVPTKDDNDKLRIDVYVQKKLVETKYFGYDEITIGRNTHTEEVDLDLSVYDLGSTISRKTLLITKQDGSYQIKDVSKLRIILNNSVMEKNKDYLLTPCTDNFVIIATTQPIGLVIRTNTK